MGIPSPAITSTKPVRRTVHERRAGGLAEATGRLTWLCNACPGEHDVVAIETLHGMPEAEQCLRTKLAVSVAVQAEARNLARAGSRRTNLCGRDRLLPVQIALLAGESALDLLAPDADDHVPCFEVRTLVRLPFKDNLGAFWHAAVDVQVEVGHCVDDASTLAGRAVVLDRLSAASTPTRGVPKEDAVSESKRFGCASPSCPDSPVAVHLHLLEDSGPQLMPHEADSSTVASLASHDVLVAPRAGACVRPDQQAGSPAVQEKETHHRIGHR